MSCIGVGIQANTLSVLFFRVSWFSSKSHYPTGVITRYDRMNVLAVFSNTILVLLAALTVLKHSMERVMQPPIVNTLVYGEIH